MAARTAKGTVYASLTAAKTVANAALVAAQGALVASEQALVVPNALVGTAEQFYNEALSATAEIVPNDTHIHDVRTLCTETFL